jgi:hypothetical protein
MVRKVKEDISQPLSPEQEKIRIREHRLVRGRFHFHELPGGILEFVYKKFPGDTLTPWVFRDGEIREIPYYVAKHLNEDCCYPEYEHVKGEDMQSTVRICRMVSRCSFENLDFNVEDLHEGPSRILRVEKV